MNGNKAMISLCVDDLLLASSDLKVLHWLKTEFCKWFKMEDCGEANICLGLEIRQDRSQKLLHFSQKRHLSVLSIGKSAKCKLYNVVYVP